MGAMYKEGDCSAAGGPPDDAIIIMGITRSGRIFRPSDWAQRLASTAAGCTRNGRLRAHPLVRVVLAEGIATVVIDKRLASSEPLLYAFLVRFADDNALRVRESCAGNAIAGGRIP